VRCCLHPTAAVVCCPLSICSTQFTSRFAQSRQNCCHDPGIAQQGCCAAACSLRPLLHACQTDTMCSLHTYSLQDTVSSPFSRDGSWVQVMGLALGGLYVTMSGTSFGAAQVAGCSGPYLASKPAQLLHTDTTPCTFPCHSPYTWYGVQSMKQVSFPHTPQSCLLSIITRCVKAR